MEINFVFYNAISKQYDDLFASKTIKCSDDAKVADLVDILREQDFNEFFPKNQKYFEKDFQSDCLWVLEEEGNREILIFYENKLILPVVNEETSLKLWVERTEKPNLYFKFYQSIYLRAKVIFTNYIGDKYQMEQDGVLNEYKIYNIDRDTEESWLVEKKIKTEIANSNLIENVIVNKKIKNYAKNNFINLLFTSIKFIVSIWLGIEVLLYPFSNKDSVGILSARFGMRVIELSSLVLGLILLIIAILVVFFAIIDYENKKK